MVDWLQISQSAGTGNATITLTASTNTELESRVTSLNVSINGKSETLSITQDAHIPISVPTNNNQIYYRTSDGNSIYPDEDYFYQSYTGNSWHSDVRCFVLSYNYDITHIPDSFFQGITNLTEIGIPNSVSYIGENAFNGCTSLKIIAFGEESNLHSIEYEGFGNCSSLENNGTIIMPEKLLYIDNCGFNTNSNKINSIEFGPNFKYFNYAAGSMMNSLSSLTFYSETAPSWDGPLGPWYSAATFESCAYNGKIYAPNSDYNSLLTQMYTSGGGGSWSVHRNTSRASFTSDTIVTSVETLYLKADTTAAKLFIYRPDSSATLTFSLSEEYGLTASLAREYGNWVVYNISLNGSTSSTPRTAILTISDGNISKTINVWQHEAEAGSFRLTSTEERVYTATGHTYVYWEGRNISHITYTTRSAGSSLTNKITSAYQSFSPDGGYFNLYYKVNTASSYSYPSELFVDFTATDYLGNTFTKTFRLYRNK